MGISMSKVRISLGLLIALVATCSAQQLPSKRGLEAEPVPTNTQPEVQLLRALLVEMRQLRLELQRNMLNQHRSNLMLERIKREQDYIDALEKRLEGVREQIRDLTSAGRYDDELEDIKETEIAIEETTDRLERADLIQDQARCKRLLERRKKVDSVSLEQQRGREREIQEKLETEKSSLLALQYQLDAMEREIAQQLAERSK
jgi:hypothetical protein